jgi:opacity protein-like surface antigen
MKIVFTTMILAVMLAWSAMAADVSGKWSGSFTPESGDPGTAYVILKQAGTSLTGTGGPDANEQWPGLQGSVHGNKISFQVKSPSDGTVYKCDLVLDGDHLKGEATFTPANGDPGKAKLELTRVTQ